MFLKLWLQVPLISSSEMLVMFQRDLRLHAGFDVFKGGLRDQGVLAAASIAVRPSPGILKLS